MMLSSFSLPEKVVREHNAANGSTEVVLIGHEVYSNSKGRNREN